MSDFRPARDFSAAALWAGLTAFVWYAFGTVPLHIAVAGQLGLTTAQTSSWIFVVWFTGAIASVAVSLFFRQPVPITWTIPGLVYLGNVADRFSLAELAGANLVAGLLLLLLAVFRGGGIVMRWLPMPILMGAFGGSVLAYATRLVSATVEDFLVAGTALGCYLAGRLIADPRLPPVGLAVIGGGIAVALTATATPEPVQWTLPALIVPEIRFSASAIVAVSLPMVVLAIGLGHIQGIGYLLAQGYRVPVNAVSVVVGVNSVVNAIFGGHASAVARTGAAILASPDAGAAPGRYWAVVISAALTLLLAFGAMPIAGFLSTLPASFIFAIAGLAIISSVQDAMEKAFGGRMRFGALVAFVVAATPFTVLGITSAFWAILAGVLAAICVERRELCDFWWPQRSTVAATGNAS